MIVYGIDPGLSTGIARFDGADLAGSWTTIRGVEGFVEWWRENPPPTGALVVIEDYISDGTVNGSVWSAEVIGAVHALHGGEVVRQLRSVKAGLIRGSEAERNAWIDARFPGLPDQHQRDAVAHALQFKKNARHREVVKYWA